MSDLVSREAIASAAKIVGRDDCDLFLYNGEIERVSDLKFIQRVHSAKKSKTCKLILVTYGGDPDAAYKISRYLQDKYEKFELLLGGLCKSAGTLIAVGAHELAFAPYGELGPLDVQLPKEDKLSGLHSGLNISEAIRALEARAFRTYLTLIGDIIKSSQGVVTFHTAARSASDVLSSLYGPILSRIDPEDVGGRTRSLRIAAEYGKRLDVRTKNMAPDGVRRLAETYPSHGFSIDRTEARVLFNRVRDADPLEMELIETLGDLARWPTSKDEPVIDCLSEHVKRGVQNAATNAKRSSRPPTAVGKDPRGTGKLAGSASGGNGRRKRPATRRGASRGVQGNSGSTSAPQQRD